MSVASFLSNLSQCSNINKAILIADVKTFTCILGIQKWSVVIKSTLHSIQMKWYKKLYLYISEIIKFYGSNNKGDSRSLQKIAEYI